MSADRLREAARVLRERAEAATPGPWEATDHFGRDAGRAYVVPGDPEIPTYVSAGGSPDEDRDADYIATMHPGVGLALSKWLDDIAAGWMWDDEDPEVVDFDGWSISFDESLDTHALALADLILGSAS